MADVPTGINSENNQPVFFKKGTDIEVTKSNYDPDETLSWTGRLVPKTSSQENMAPTPIIADESIRPKNPGTPNITTGTNEAVQRFKPSEFPTMAHPVAPVENLSFIGKLKKLFGGK